MRYSQSFFRFCTKECFLFFFNALSIPSRAALTSRSGQLGILFFLRYNLDRFPLISMPRVERKNRQCIAPVPLSFAENKDRYANILYTWWYSPPKMWHVSSGAQLSALTARRTLEDNISGRVIIGRRVLSRRQHSETNTNLR